MARQGDQSGGSVAEERTSWTVSPPRTTRPSAAGHDRWRDRTGFRRCGICRQKWKRLASDCRNCGCCALRKTSWCTRPRSLGAGELRLPAGSRGAHVARNFIQQFMLATSPRGAPGDGVRHAGFRFGQGHSFRVLRGGHSLLGATHLHPGQRVYRHRQPRCGCGRAALTD